MKWAIYCLPTGGIKTKSFFLCTLETMRKEKRPPRAIPQRTSRISGSYRSVWRKQRVVSMRVPRCRGPKGSERGHRLPAMGEQQGTTPNRAKGGPVNFLACSNGTRTRRASRQSVWGQYFIQRDCGALILYRQTHQLRSAGRAYAHPQLGCASPSSLTWLGGHARPVSRSFTRQNRL